MKDIICAEKHLKGIFDSQAKEPRANLRMCPTSASPTLADSGITHIAVVPTVSFEANNKTDDSILGKVYPKTPLPNRSEPSLPINSTPICTCDDNSSSNGFPACQPCAIEFEDSVVGAYSSSSSYSSPGALLYGRVNGLDDRGHPQDKRIRETYSQRRNDSGKLYKYLTVNIV